MAYATNREVEIQGRALRHRPGRRTARRLRPRQAVRGPAATPRRLQCRAGRAGTLIARGRREAEAAREHRPPRVSDDRPRAVSLPPGVHASAAHAFRLTAAGAEAIAVRTWTRRDAAGRCDLFEPRFQGGFRREMAAMFPDQHAGADSGGHPIFTAEFGGDDLRRWSGASRSGPTATDRSKSRCGPGEPYLEGIKLGDRYAVIFSPYDLELRTGESRFARVRRLHAQDAARGSGSTCSCIRSTSSRLCENYLPGRKRKLWLWKPKRLLGHPTGHHS